jgi:uncharacterized protein YbjQ (UPF0145 family)
MSVKGEKGMNCPVCGNEVPDNARFCFKCGAAISPEATKFLITTTPTIQGFKIKKILGVVTGLTPRTRGFLGQFIGGIQSIFGGEITAFTEELEKARVEAIERVRAKAMNMGANAIVGLDLETSDMGREAPIIVFSATGTAVIVEPETS